MKVAKRWQVKINLDKRLFAIGVLTYKTKFSYDIFICIFPMIVVWIHRDQYKTEEYSYIDDIRKENPNLRP